MQPSRTASRRFYRAFYRWTVLTSAPHARRLTTQAAEDDTFSIRAHPSTSTHSDSRIRRRLKKAVERPSAAQSSGVNNGERACEEAAAPLQETSARAPRGLRIVKHPTHGEDYTGINGLYVRKHNVREVDFENYNNTEEFSHAEQSNHTEAPDDISEDRKLRMRRQPVLKSDHDVPSKLLDRIPFATESQRPFSELGPGTKVIRERSETAIRVDCVVDGRQVEQLRSKYGDLSTWFWNEHVVRVQVQDEKGQTPDDDGIKDLEGRWLVMISGRSPGNLVRALKVLDRQRLGRLDDRMVMRATEQAKIGDYIVQHRDGDQIDVKFGLSNIALQAAQKEYGSDLQLLMKLFNGSVSIMASSKNPKKARVRPVHPVFISGTHTEAEILIDHLSEFTWCDSTPVGEESSSSANTPVTPPTENLNVEAATEGESDPLAGFKHFSRIEAPARKVPLYTHVLRERNRDFAEVEVVLPNDSFDQFIARNSIESVQSRYDIIVKVGEPEFRQSEIHPALERGGRSFLLRGHPQGVRDACFWLKDVLVEMERSDAVKQGQKANLVAAQAAKPSLARSCEEIHHATGQDKTAANTFGSSRGTSTSTPRAIDQDQVRDSAAGHDSAGEGDSSHVASKQHPRFLVVIGPGSRKRKQRFYFVLRRFVKGLPSTERIDGLEVSRGKIFITGRPETVTKARLLLEARLAQEVQTMQITLVPAGVEPLQEETFQRVKVQITPEDSRTSEWRTRMSKSLRLPMHHYAQDGQLFLVSTPRGLERLRRSLQSRIRKQDPNMRVELQRLDMNATVPEVPAVGKAGGESVPDEIDRAEMASKDPEDMAEQGLGNQETPFSPLRAQMAPRILQDPSGQDTEPRTTQVEAPVEVEDVGQDAGNNETRFAPPQAQTAPRITRDGLGQQPQWEDEAETVKSKAADSSALYKRRYSIGRISSAILPTVSFHELPAMAIETSCSSCSIVSPRGDIFEVVGTNSSLVKFDCMLKARLRIVCRSSGIPSPEVKFEEFKTFSKQTGGNKTSSRMAEYLQEAAKVSDEVRSVLRTLTHPVVVITSQLGKADDREHDQGRGARAVTVSSFNTVALKPQAIVSFNLKVPSRTWDAISASNYFRIHLMTASPAGAALANIFTQAYDEPEHGFSQLERLGAKISYFQGPNPPLILQPDAVIAHIRAHLMPEKCVHVGDHVIVVARVTSCYFDKRLSENSEAIHGLAYGKQAYRGSADEIRLPETPSAKVNSHSSTGGRVRRGPFQRDDSHSRPYAEPQNDPVFDVLRATRDAAEGVPSRQGIDVDRLLSGIAADGLGEEGYNPENQRGRPKKDSQPRGNRSARARMDRVGSHSGKEALYPEMADSNAAELMPQVADTPLWGPGDAAREDSGPGSNSGESGRRSYSTIARARLPGFSAKRFFSSSSQKPKDETRMHEVDAKMRDRVEPSAMKMNVADYLGVPDDNAFWQVHRVRSLVALNRRARKAEWRLENDYRMSDAERAELRDTMERNDRIIAKKLAQTAADDLRIMLDKGRVDFERARFMESTIEKGMAVLLEEAKLARQELDQGKINALEFKLVKEELERTNAELTTEANRLRQFVDESVDESVDGPSEYAHGDKEGGEKFDGFEGNR